MLISAIFLVSCIITARLLEKKKLHVASAAYSILFVIVLAVLFLTSDVEPIQQTLSGMMGTKAYLQTKEALLYALRSAGYGTCILVALFFTLFLQISLPLIYAVATIVRRFKKGREAVLSKRDQYRCPYPSRTVALPKQINLLYCRMLN